MLLHLNPAETACLTIDLHRGHLDPAVATMPVAAPVAEQVTQANAAFLNELRARGVAVIHAVTIYRDAAEILSMPIWERKHNDPTSTRKNVARHNLAGMPGTQLMPGIFAEGDIVVDTKKRYNCFVATELAFQLQIRGIKNLVLTGINTNSCVLATAVDACNRDLLPIVVSDCVNSQDGPELHTTALRILETAFALVPTADQVLAALSRREEA